MTTTTETTTCRPCGATITQDYEVPADAIDNGPKSWKAIDGNRPGDFHCPDGKPHEPGCPPSSVVDAIVHWDEVREGDLVLHADELTPVEQWMLHTARPDLHVAVRLSGHGLWQTKPRNGYTAVRRYVEG